MNQEILFETVLRTTKTDWFGVTLFFSGLTLLIAVLYRNPLVIKSLIIRSFKSESEKLYFSAPAVDSIDRLLLTLIFLVSSMLSIHYFVEIHFSSSIRFLLYSLPLLVVSFFVIPFKIISFLIGFSKLSNSVLRRQLPIIHLFGIIVLIFEGLLFVEFGYSIQLNLIILGVLGAGFLWMHIKAISQLIRSGFSVYYIFIYFCTLEILPIAFLLVWMLRI